MCCRPPPLVYRHTHRTGIAAAIGPAYRRPEKLDPFTDAQIKGSPKIEEVQVVNIQAVQVDTRPGAQNKVPPGRGEGARARLRIPLAPHAVTAVVLP